MEQVIQALSDALTYIESNLDGDTGEQVALIPKLIRGYIALAKLTNTPIEEMYKQRKGSKEEELPSILRHALEVDDDPEWEWTENLIADMWRLGFKDCKKVRVFICEDDDRFDKVEVEGRPHEIISSFWVPQTDTDATKAIAEIIEMCFEYHGFEVIPATDHWPEDESHNNTYVATVSTLLPAMFSTKGEVISDLQEYHGANGYGWVPAFKIVEVEDA